MSFEKRANNKDLFRRIREAFASQPLSHWRKCLGESGCVWTAVQTPLEIPEDPQAVANGYVPEHPSIPRARLVASPVQYKDGTVEITSGAPKAGQHTEEILLELGLDWPEIAQLKERSVIG